MHGRIADVLIYLAENIYYNLKSSIFHCQGRTSLNSQECQKTVPSGYSRSLKVKGLFRQSAGVSNIQKMELLKEISLRG